MRNKSFTFLASFFMFIFPLVLNAQMPNKTDFSLPKLYQDNGDGFTVIAHRGASAYYPENTMAAFEGALSMNAEMIELDIMLSKDGVPVAFHDAELDDHSDGSGMLADYTLEELQKLDVGSWFGAEFSGERIPTLKEVLQFASGKIALNIEIKTEAVSDELRGGVEEKCIKLVREYGMEEHVLFSSFDYRAVEHLKELAPEMSVALLYEQKQSKGMSPSELLDTYNADAFNCSYRQLKGKRLKDIKKHNLPVFIYTVDKETKMKRLLDMGVSGIFTNKPDVLLGLLESRKNQ